MKDRFDKSKHTDGPWDIHGDLQQLTNRTLEIHPMSDENGEHIIAEIPADADQPDAEKRANALLISLAPELYELLRWVTRCASFAIPPGVKAYAISNEVMNQAKTLIYKLEVGP
jgi:hypothetical protein